MKDLQSRKIVLGERIKEIRKYRKLSLRKLAAIADMEHSHINLIEKGETSPSVLVLEALANALNVTPSDLFNYTISPIDVYVCQRVREMRLERKLTQKELSELLNLHEDFITDVEAGELKITYTVSQLNQIANIFNNSLNSFFPTRLL